MPDQNGAAALAGFMYAERRLPAMFAGKPITFRIPYTMRGELVVPNFTTGVPFPDATFLHNVEKPFEIHRVRLHTLPFDNATPPVAVSPGVLLQQSLDARKFLDDYVRLDILDQSKNERLTRGPTLIESLVTANARTWEWEDPYTIVRAEGFQMTVDNLAPPTFPICFTCPTQGQVVVANINVRVALQGYLLVIAPPSETR